MKGKDDELADHLDRQLAAALFAVARFGSPRAAAQFASQALARHLGLDTIEFEKHVEEAIALLRAGSR